MIKLIDTIKKYREIFTLVLLIIISLIGMSLETGRKILKPKEAGFSVVSVLQMGMSGIGEFVSGTVNSISELRQLKEAYDDLQNKINEYEEIERNIVELEIENKTLRQQLGFASTAKFETIPAEVTGKDPGNTFNSIIINKGSSSGVTRNMPVIALQDGFHGLVGKITEVGRFSSIVTPIYNESSFVSSRLQNSRYEGLINGSGFSESVLFMNYVKKIAREEIEYGDFVVTSGMKSIYPKGIYIGRVTAIEGKEWDTSLQLEIEPVVEFTKLEYVFVLSGGE